MITSDPDAWVGARVDALEAANGAAVEKIAAMEAEIGRLYRMSRELEATVHRLEAALDAHRAALVAAAPSRPATTQPGPGLLNT